MATTNSLNNESSPLDVDNLNLDGNTLSSTDANGDVNLSPDGSGRVVASSEVESTSVLVDPGASGDSYIQFDINNTGEFRIGVDDDDSDAFKISQGSALGTNDFLTISSSGVVNQPLQPRFRVRLNGNVASVTGNGTDYTIVWNSVSVDVGSGMDTGTGVYTVPASGFWFLTTCVQFTTITSANILFIEIPSSGGSTRRFYFENSSIGGECSISNMEIFQYTLSDTIVVNAVADGQGADTVGIRGGTTPNTTYFSGCLLA